MTPTGARVLVSVGALLGFGVLAAAVFVQTLAPFSMLALGLGLSCAFRLMLWTHSRPVVTIYEMGIERGRRDAIREANGRGPSGGKPIFLQQVDSA